MLNDKSVEAFLSDHEHRQIGGGHSGARIWEIDGRYVLKHVIKDMLPEPEMFPLYLNEALFYQFYREEGHGEALPCLPEVLETRVSDREILLLMKKYRQPSKEALDDGLLRGIMRALAQVHTREIPDFLKRPQGEPGYLKAERIAECVDGWRSVLAEHPGALDPGILERTADRINQIIGWHHEEPQVLCHGDFHWDNLLLRENGEIVICDWQGVNGGGASGDISFFISRLGADGTEIAPEKLVEIYVQERALLTGETLSEDILLGHMQAANSITTFQFWHEYLHGSACGRVRGIYEKMGK